MFLDEDESQGGANGTHVTTWAALRHVMVFQLKLAADALRDFLLSPLSIVAFLIDVLRKPRADRSLYLRLMLLGRRSDRFINLFDDHSDAGKFTIDRAVDELEVLVRAGSRTHRQSEAGKEAGEEAGEKAKHDKTDNKKTESTDARSTQT